MKKNAPTIGDFAEKSILDRPMPPEVEDFVGELREFVGENPKKTKTVNDMLEEIAELDKLEGNIESCMTKIGAIMDAIAEAGLTDDFYDLSNDEMKEHPFKVWSATRQGYRYDIIIQKDSD